MREHKMETSTHPSEDQFSSVTRARAYGDDVEVGENGDAARLPESTIRDRHSHDHKAREDAARQWFASKMPGLAWDDQPEAVRMAWRAAVTEKHYPRTCTEC